MQTCYGGIVFKPPPDAQGSPTSQHQQQPRQLRHLIPGSNWQPDLDALQRQEKDRRGGGGACIHIQCVLHLWEKRERANRNTGGFPNACYAVLLERWRNWIVPLKQFGSFIERQDARNSYRIHYYVRLDSAQEPSEVFVPQVLECALYENGAEVRQDPDYLIFFVSLNTVVCTLLCPALPTLPTVCSTIVADYVDQEKLFQSLSKGFHSFHTSKAKI